MLVTKAKSLLESMKELQGQAKDKLEFITLHISERDYRNEVMEIKYLLNFFRTTASLIYENINHSEVPWLELKKEYIHSLAETYSSTDSDE
ncbi:hypothetical protein TNCV_2240081 [Trichonephila clavipes]|nr:hypothetical protein TNCV_2240081 [Trichonephila clavipes]